MHQPDLRKGLPLPRDRRLSAIREASHLGVASAAGEVLAVDGDGQVHGGGELRVVSPPTMTGSMLETTGAGADAVRPKLDGLQPRGPSLLRMTPEEGYPPLLDVATWPSLDLSDTWTEFLAMLDQRRVAATPESLRRALEVALRSAALETGAIEGLYASSRGLTRTVALQGAMWEAALDEIGPDVRGHFEAQLDALEHVLNLVTKVRPISEVWLRELHAVICRNQKSYRQDTSRVAGAPASARSVQDTG